MRIFRRCIEFVINMKDRIISNVSKTSVPRKHPNNTIYNHYTDTVIFIYMWQWLITDWDLIRGPWDGTGHPGTVLRIGSFSRLVMVWGSRGKDLTVKFAVVLRPHLTLNLKHSCFLFNILNAWLIYYDSQSGMNIKNVSFGIVTDVKVISISFLSNKSSINLLVNCFIFTNKNFILSFGVPEHLIQSLADFDDFHFRRLKYSWVKFWDNFSAFLCIRLFQKLKLIK